jgi:hypothetical protein
VSTWADEIRPQHPETRRWHFVSIPIHPNAGESSGYDAVRDCPQQECVVAKIDEFERVLAASNNDDRGGNDVAVTFMGQQANLHAVWDSGIIGPAVKGDERAYALLLAGDITLVERQQWSGGQCRVLGKREL